MVSLVIIVKNDPRIERLLLKIEALSVSQPVEVIVVDASRGALDYVKDTFRFVKWLYYIKNVKKRTYSEQRNVGIKSSHGDIIVFIDADCIPEQDWLMHLTEPIQKGEEKIVSGACRPVTNNYIHKEEIYGEYRDECETMNMAISMDVIDAVGLFDEALEGCEDSDFCIRARAHGFTIRHVPDAVIYHDWGGFRKNIMRSFYGGKDRARLYRKHTKYLTSLSINNIYTFYYVFYLLFLPIALIYPIYIFVVCIPSIIKRRNPLKELFNLSFSIGFLKQVLYL